MKPKAQHEVEAGGRRLPVKAEQPWGPVAFSQRIDPPSTQADRVTRLIFEDIIKAGLRPGERLKPEALSERYGVGLSPIREALFRLTADGLVRGGGHRGFAVPEISIDELLDIANVRAELSGLALRESIRCGDDKWEVGVITAYHSIERIPVSLREDPEAFANIWENRNWSFHEALEAACESPWLKHFISLTAVHTRRYRGRFFDYDLDSRIAQAEHKAIMDAALDRDADTACKLMTEHVLSRVRALKEAMDRQAPREQNKRRKYPKGGGA
jgi:GntR family transcriptional regulator, carbon starvation induced regulator